LRRQFSTKIPTALIAELRKQSGSPIRECKKALEASNGNVAEAWEMLRKMGAATAQKKSQNATAHGLIAVSAGQKVGAVFQMASETDFVEGNPKLQDLTYQLASLVASSETPGEVNLDAFRSLIVPETGRSVADSVTDLVGSIRENLQLVRGYQVRVDKGVVGVYVHNKIGDHCGLRASLVALESDAEPEAIQKLAKDIAMHVVAHSPQPKYLHQGEVPEEVLEKEKEIIKDQLSAEGKSPAVLDKVVSGRMKKFHEDNTLLNQNFCLADDNISIQKLVATSEKELGCSIKVSDFTVYNLDDVL